MGRHAHAHRRRLSVWHHGASRARSLDAGTALLRSRARLIARSHVQSSAGVPFALTRDPSTRILFTVNRVSFAAFI